MKKILSCLILMILLAAAPVYRAYAVSVSISGGGNIVAGRTYTFSVQVSANASSIGGTISVSGCATGGGNFWKDSASGLNENITATANINVTVNANAAIGETAVITVSGEGSSVNAETKAVSTFAISGSKQLTVAPAPTPPPPTEWEIAQSNIKKMSPGDEIDIEITKPDKTLPGSLLTALHEKEGSVNIDLGGYSCHIDGADLANIGDDVPNVDLTVDMEKNEEVSGAADGRDILQLHFNHEGPFPCRLTFTFPVEGRQPGDIVYVYYYIPASRLIEGKEKAVVAEDGTISFTVWHASSYFVTDTIMPDAVSNFTDTSQYDAQIRELNDQIAENDASIADLEASLTEEKDKVLELQAQAEEQSQDKHTETSARLSSGIWEPGDTPLWLTVTIGLLCIALGGGLVYLYLTRMGRGPVRRE